MAIYIVDRTDRTDYDEYDAVMVRASSEKEALALVCTPMPDINGYEDDYRGFKADGSNAKVTKILGTGESAVLLSSFHAG